MKWQKHRKSLLFAIKLIVTLGGLLYTYYNIDLAAMAAALKSASIPILLGAFMVITLSKFISALRSYLLLRTAGVNISFTDNTKLFFVGSFYNSFLPGGIGGDAYKVLLLGGNVSKRIRNIGLLFLIDRFSGLWAIVLLVLCLIIIRTLPESDLTVWTICAIVATVAFATKQFLIEAIYPRINRIVFKISVLSIALQLTQSAGALIILFSLHETSHLTQYLLLFLLSSVASVVPLSIGGLGVREAVVVVLNNSFQWNIDSRSLVSFTFIFFLLGLLSSLPGVLVPVRSMKVDTVSVKQSDQGSDRLMA